MSTATAASMWKTTASNSEGGDYERPKAGMYPAVCVALVDLGTHSFNFTNKKTNQPETFEKRKIYLAWELTGENDSKGQTFVVGQEFTWSLGKKANLRPLIEGWIGRTLADKEDFEIISLLGKECCITISEGMSGGGKHFSEIAGVGPVMKGLVIPPASHEVFAFNLALLNSSLDPIDIPDWMPRNYGRPLAEDIRKSKEFGDLPPI